MLQKKIVFSRLLCSPFYFHNNLQAPSYASMLQIHITIIYYLAATYLNHNKKMDNSF